MKKQYTYKVGGVILATRESARMVQRSIRQQSAVDPDVKVPKIVQRVVIEKEIR
jgi:hypothetical protein